MHKTIKCENLGSTFIRKTPPSSGQVVVFEQLVRGILPFYGQTVDSGSTNISNKTFGGFE